MVTLDMLCLNRNLILWGRWGFFSHSLLIKREEEEEPWRLAAPLVWAQQPLVGI